MDLLFGPFRFFVEHPLAGFLPATLFGCWFAHAFRGSRTLWTPGTISLLAAAVLWSCYGVWEIYVSLVLPPRNGPVRVDLLFIAPVLWIASVAAIVLALVFRTRHSPR